MFILALFAVVLGVLIYFLVTKAFPQKEGFEMSGRNSNHGGGFFVYMKSNNSPYAR